MNENINLCEILKNCPKGTKFDSYVFGRVEFWGILYGTRCPIRIKAFPKGRDPHFAYITKEGYFTDDYSNAKCILIPSFNQPDWNKYRYWED